MAFPIDLLAQATESVRAMEVSGLHAITDDELCALVVAAEAHGRLVDSLRVRVAAEIADRSSASLGSAGLAERRGFTRGVYLLEFLTRVSAAEASRRVRLGATLRSEVSLSGEVLAARFAVLEQFHRAGEIDSDAAISIVRCLTDASRTAGIDELEAAQRLLVDAARQESADCVANIARMLRDRLDPDGVRPREEETRARRGIRLGRERNGVTPISGALEPTAAALLKSAFSEANAPAVLPRFLSEQDRRDGTETVTEQDGSISIRQRDVRSREQRQHDVFVGLLKAGVRNAGVDDGAMRSTADVTAVILLSELQSGTGAGWLEGVDEPVSAATVQQLACDARYRRAVLGADGEVLQLGRTRYPFSRAQRRAMSIRDGGCVWEGCMAPPGWCDAHHVQEFNANGSLGKTDVDNGVLLCGEHHAYLHRSEWRMRMIRGRPQVLAPFSLDPGQKWRTVGRSPVAMRLTG